MASVGGIVATVLSVLVGLVFAFSGSVKLFPAVNPEFHQEMVVGSLELVSGPGIILFPSELKTICNGILFVIMCGATYTHFVLGEPFVVPLAPGEPSKEKAQ
ncbi:DoxX-like [Branchiostoma belcheri]|nr:DoxX-like [Branchiostoma belcheri]